MSAASSSALADDGLAAWIAPRRTAVLIVDMQVDFASPDGALSRWIDMRTVAPALAKAQTLVDAAREAGALVVFTGLSTTPETDSAAWSERLRRRGDDPESIALCRAGTPGAAFHGPQPLAGDPIIHKTRYSAFVGTDLDVQLTRMGIDTLVVAGLTTECCVDSTVRDAFDLDYHVFVAADACVAYATDLHEAALKVMALNSAILTDTMAIAAAWKEGG